MKIPLHFRLCFAALILFGAAGAVPAQVAVILENHGAAPLKVTMGSNPPLTLEGFARLELDLDLKDRGVSSPWLVEAKETSALLPVPLADGFAWRVVLDLGPRGPLVKSLERGCPALGDPGAGPPGTRPWQEEDYRRYTWQQFQELPAARATMDLNNIDHGLLAAALYFETVRVRQEHSRHLPRLDFSAALQMGARLHSEQMVFYDFFDHENAFDKRWYDMDSRLGFFGVRGGFRGENIADHFALKYIGGSLVLIPGRDSKAFRSPGTEEPLPPHSYLSLARRVLKELMESPPHRANILHPDFRFLGTAAALYKDKDFHGMPRFKVTQTFASRVPDGCWDLMGADAPPQGGEKAKP